MADTVRLDPFRQKRLRPIAERWTAAQREHQVVAMDLWLGMMMQRFDADELELLDAAGYLCDNDRDLIVHRRTIIHPPSERGTN